MKARDYQIKCTDETFAAFERGAKGVLNALPTGSGKTAVAGFMAQRMNSYLFVVDREELAFQSQKTLSAITGQQVYLECGSEYKAFRTAPNARFVVAMSQSMKNRKEAYPRDRFEYIFEDECFVGGTLVDGKPIENIASGDFVRSFNHELLRTECNKVLTTFKTKPKRLMKVNYTDGTFVVCTPGHPFNTADAGAYVQAGNLSAGDFVGSHRKWNQIHSTEHLPQTDDGTFGGWCPEKYVFNIEVEHNNNYFVNDVLVHNCHHSVSATRTAIREYFTGKKGVIGFSATPTRLDGKAAGMVYDTVAMQMSYLDGVDLGWLVPFKSRVVSCMDMDLRQFKGSSEYTDKELRKQIEKEAVIEHICRKTIAIADGRQTIIFARTVEQSQLIQRYLKSIGEKATHVDGKMHRYMRRERIGQFTARNFQFICNCGLIEEGVDVPGIEVVSMAAPMRSTGRFMQRVGRGSRATIELTGDTPEERRKQIAESDKPHFTVIDFIGQMDEHSAAMCFAGDLLAGDFDDETRKVAIRLATGKENPDMRAIIAEAKDIISHRRRKLSPKEEKELARERYKKADRTKENVWSMRTTFHPFDVLKMDRRAPDREIPKSDQYGRVLAGSEQYLKENNLYPQEINLLTNSQRVYLARFLRARVETHAPYAQLRRIHACGYDAANLSRSQANVISKRIEDAGFVRPTEDGPNQLYLAAQSGAAISSSKDYVFL